MANGRPISACSVSEAAVAPVIRGPRVHRFTLDVYGHFMPGQGADPAAAVAGLVGL